MSTIASNIKAMSRRIPAMQAVSRRYFSAGGNAAPVRQFVHTDVTNGVATITLKVPAVVLSEVDRSYFAFAG